MDKTAMDMVLNGLTWVPVDLSHAEQHQHPGVPYATHEGIWEFNGHQIRCYRLSNGQAVIDQEDFMAFFNDAIPDGDNE